MENKIETETQKTPLQELPVNQRGSLKPRAVTHSALDQRKAAIRKKQREATRKHMPWIEKYRPNNMDQLIGHTHIIATSKILAGTAHL